MEAVKYIYQVSPWLLLCLECAALFVVLSWPMVKGKSWLVASLLVFLLVDLCTQLLSSSATPAEPVLMGPDEYQQLWNDWFQLSCLALVGKVLFVIAVFRLGVGLKRFMSPVSTDYEAREI
ncbi:hypothetical protein [Gimesia sp.]|uniref:hypothetical protein n=1 Tax=Gimesia sp. TaxID=2024833 RepID=UPI000C4A85EE|nr:hypothetical protein [Gimesia sp.]MAX40316.1 hypothetical protein [Gimesia sp.]HBL42518.1 hypothetical protein [Planctomycetaceae bacterium]